VARLCLRYIYVSLSFSLSKEALYDKMMNDSVSHIFTGKRIPWKHAADNYIAIGMHNEINFFLPFVELPHITQHGFKLDFNQTTTAYVKNIWI
jgi:hypothetical protein